MYRIVLSFTVTLLVATLSAQDFKQFKAEAERATQLVNARKFAEAKPITDKLLEWSKNSFSNKIEATMPLFVLANAYNSAGHPVELAALLRQAKKTLENAGTTEGPYYATMLTALAIGVAVSEGNFSEAETYAEQALAIVEKSGDSQPLVLGLTCSSIAGLEQMQGRYDKAEALHRRAEAIFRKCGDKMNLAIVLSYLAHFYSAQNRLDEAGKNAEEALKLVEGIHGPDGLTTASYLTTLGGVELSKGNYADGETILDRAVKILQTNDRLEAVEAATAFRHLGILQIEQGRYEKGEEYLKTALAVSENVFGKNHPEQSAVLCDLGYLYLSQKRYDEAVAIHERGLRIAMERLDENHPSIAANLNNLAVACHDRGEMQKAKEYYEKALRIRENSLGKDNIVTVLTARNLGMIAYQQEKYQDAEPFFNRAIQAVEQGIVPPFRGAEWYSNRAWLYRKTDRADRAVADLKKAMDQSLEIRKQASGNDEQRAQTFGRYYHFFETMVDWQFSSGNMSEAYDAMERSRAQGLQDLINANGIDLLAGLPAGTVKTLRDAENAAQRDVAAFEKQLEVLATRTDLDVGRKQAEKKLAETSLADARKRLVVAMTAIRAASPAYRLMIAEDRKPVPLDTVRNALVAEKSLALEYLLGNEKSYLLLYGIDTEPRLLPLLLDEKQAEVFNVEAGPLTADKFETILQNKTNDGVLQTVADPKRIGQDGLLDPKTRDKLALLWTILVPDEKGRTKIVDGTTFSNLLILPDGALAKLPFEMLVVESDAVNPRYLLDLGPAVVYAPSASMYFNLSKFRKSPPAQGSTLTLGNPDYETKKVAKPGNSIHLLVQSRRTARFGTLQPLPWTAEETRWIADSCRKNGISVTQLEQVAVTEANLRRHVAGRKIVHLACHGLAENDFGNMFGALALTPGNVDDSKDDGFLTLAEMFALDLKSCELAALSACETNLGPNQHGEGTWSMGRGMLASGAKRVVTTDWQVADDASAVLIYHFIDSANTAKSLDYAAALREAKRSIRNGRDHPAWQHPYYWAPFVLLGTN